MQLTLNFVKTIFSTTSLQKRWHLRSAKLVYFSVNVTPLDRSKPSLPWTIMFIKTNGQIGYTLLLFHTDPQTDVCPNAIRTESIVTTLSALHHPTACVALQQLTASQSLNDPIHSAFFHWQRETEGSINCHRRQATAKQVQHCTENDGRVTEERANSWEINQRLSSPVPRVWTALHKEQQAVRLFVSHP